MNNYYQMELKKAFYSRRFLTAIIFSFICLCVGSIEYLSGYINSNNTGSFYLFTESYSSGFYSIFIYLLPIICSIPFALSYLDEMESRSLDVIVKKIGLKKYIKTKLLVNMLCGGITISLSLIIYYLFLILIKGISPGDMSYYELNQSLGSFIGNNQFLYILIEIIFSFICGATFSNITFCISFLLKDKYLSLLSSLFFYMLSAVVLSRFSTYLNSQIIYSFSLNIDIGILPRVIYACVLNLISIFILTLRCKVDNLNINIKLLLKIISYLSLLLILYVKVDEFLLLYNNQGSVYEFLIYLSNDFYTVSYFISFCFLVISNELFIESNLENSLFYNFKNIFITLSKFMIIFLTFSLVMSIFRLDINLDWSEFNKLSEVFVSIHKTYSPIFVLFISLIHMFLYLFSIVFIGITIMKISRNSIVGLIGASTVIIFNICTSLGRITFLNIISLSRNANSIFQLTPKSSYLYFVPSLVYWICLIFIICNIYLDYSNINLSSKSKKVKKNNV